MENIKQMRARHGAEIKSLQDKCKHRKPAWMEDFGGEARVCDFCGKILEANYEIPSTVTTVSKSNVYTPISKTVWVETPSANRSRAKEM